MSLKTMKMDIAKYADYFHDGSLVNFMPIPIDWRPKSGNIGGYFPKTLARSK